MSSVSILDVSVTSWHFCKALVYESVCSQIFFNDNRLHFCLSGNALFLTSCLVFKNVQKQMVHLVVSSSHVVGTISTELSSANSTTENVFVSISSLRARGPPGVSGALRSLCTFAYRDGGAELRGCMLVVDIASKKPPPRI